MVVNVFGRRGRARLVVVIGASGVLSGCASLPTNGPTANQIVRQERDEASRIGFQIIDLTSTTIPTNQLAYDMATEPMAALRQDGRTDLVGPGDVLSITIFEVGVTLFSSPSSGLGGPTGGTGNMPSSFDPGARAQNLSGVTVAEDGHIRLPFIGSLEVAGKTTSEIERMIVQGLRGKSQAPQAVVSVTQNVRNTVIVSGAAARPGRVALTAAHERLLDVVATVGGTVGDSRPENTVVRLTRNGRSAEVYLDQIVASSSADVPLLPGDRVELLRRARTFSVFGAAGRVSQIAMQTATVTLAEAVAQAGGPEDARADPTAVFVFRDTRQTPPAPGEPAPAVAGPIVYRLNMMKPSAYFVSQRFQMHDKDVIFIANARINQTRKLVEIFNALFTPVLLLRNAVQ